MNKVLFLITLFIFSYTLQNQSSLWIGLISRASKKPITIKTDECMANVCSSIFENAEKIQVSRILLSTENLNIKMADQLDSDQTSTYVESNDENTFLYTHNIFQCVALGIIKFSSHDKIERYLFHLNFFNENIEVKKREIRSILNSLYGFSYKIALSSAMYSHNLFNIVEMIEAYNFKITDASVFPIWYPNSSVDYISHGGSFYIVDKIDCNIALDQEPPYKIPLKSNQQGWWGPKSLIITPDGNFYHMPL